MNKLPQFGRNYMPKLMVSSWYIVNKAWVKYVNNLRTLISITSGRISTKKTASTQKYITLWAQRRFYKLNYTHFSPTIFTTMNHKFNLLNKTFTHNPQSLLLKLIKEI